MIPKTPPQVFEADHYVSQPEINVEDLEKEPADKSPDQANANVGESPKSFFAALDDHPCQGTSQCSNN